MAKQLSKAQLNHLRRLLGWVRCEIPPAPNTIVDIVRKIAPVIDEDNHEGKARLVEWHREASNVPKYIRAANKSLEPVVRDSDGQIVDVEINERRMLGRKQPRIEAK